MPRPLSLKKKVAFSVAIALITYAIAECFCTAFLSAPTGSLNSDTFAIQEDTGGFCLDLVQGYKITRGPTRVARVTNGLIEFVGAFRGNAQGFQGRDDFSVHKTNGKRRYIVFGDSFTSAAFLQTRWTDRAATKVPNIEFYNFAIDGAGLANWWSVLTREIIPKGYEFDGVIFSIIPNDLNRPFMVADYRWDAEFLSLGYVGWGPKLLPLDAKDATILLQDRSYRKVRPIDFESSIVRRRLCRAGNHETTPWIASRLLSYVRRRHRGDETAIGPFASVPVRKLEAAPGNDDFNPWQMAVILDMERALRGKPVIIVHIPLRDELLAKQDASPRVQSFAHLMGARFVDGSTPFRSLDAAEIRACYLPVDGHWNQVGSDRFAAFVAERLK
jgi:hypothetical protein